MIASQNPSDFDLQAYFLKSGCDVQLSNLLADQLPSACGRILCEELGIINSDFYQRMQADGRLGPEERYDEDPIWIVVEAFAKKLSQSTETRSQFSELASQSEQVDAVNKALNAGESLEGLRGARMGNGVYNAPLKPGF